MNANITLIVRFSSLHQMTPLMARQYKLMKWWNVGSVLIPHLLPALKLTHFLFLF